MKKRGQEAVSLLKAQQLAASNLCKSGKKSVDFTPTPTFTDIRAVTASDTSFL